MESQPGNLTINHVVNVANPILATGGDELPRRKALPRLVMLNSPGRIDPRFIAIEWLRCQQDFPAATLGVVRLVEVKGGSFDYKNPVGYHLHGELYVRTHVVFGATCRRYRMSTLDLPTMLRMSPGSAEHGEAVFPQADYQPKDSSTTRTIEYSVAPTRSPLPGMVLTRCYKGQLIQVRVLANGFEYLGERYRSLSAIAKQITGSHCSGNRFFHLTTSTGDQ